MLQHTNFEILPKFVRVRPWLHRQNAGHVRWRYIDPDRDRKKRNLVVIIPLGIDGAEASRVCQCPEDNLFVWGRDLDPSHMGTALRERQAMYVPCQKGLRSLLVAAPEEIGLPNGLRVETGFIADQSDREQQCQ